jgi:hypothetical protein
MISIAKRHFPQISYHNGLKWLWNPVLKKRYKIRPEEVVRLQYLEALIEEQRWSGNRIAFELPVRSRKYETAKRADIVCYSQQMKSQIVIECKAPTIAITESTAAQASKYNDVIGAPWLILTNGKEDILYNASDKKTVAHHNSFFPTPLPLHYSLNYWKTRGFAGSLFDAKHQKILLQVLETLFVKKHKTFPVRYLRINQQIDGIHLPHAYLYVELDDGFAVDCTVIASVSGETYLLAVISRDHQQFGLIHIQLDAALAGISAPVKLYGPGFQKSHDLSYFKTNIETLCALQPGDLAAECVRFIETFR